MSKNVLMILAVIVTVLAGWLVIQIASPGAGRGARPAKNGNGAAVVAPRGGEMVEVDTMLNIPANEVDTSLNIE